MKLGLVVPGGFDPSGREGTIPALLALTEALGQRHDVRVLATSGRSGAGRYRVAAADVTQLDLEDDSRDAAGLAGWARRGARLARLAAAVEGWMTASGPFDVVHAFWADRTALLAALAARRRSTPFVVSVGGGECVWLPDIGYGGAGTTAGRLVPRAVLGLARATTAGSDFVRGLLPATAGARAEVVPLGVDTARFAPPPARLAGPPWRLIHVASLNPVKDQRTLLQAFRRVVDRLGGVELDIVGEDRLDGEVQRLARALGLGGRVVFHGFLAQEDLAARYRAAHLHVLSSRHESQGVVVLEAAAAGLPTVGTAVGLLPALAPGAARVVPPNDAAALGDAICAVLLDRAGREAMGAAAQLFAQAQDAAWTARTFEAIYARVTRSAGTSAGRGRTS